MAAPVLWLAFYLSAGALVLWACYNSSACRLDARLERNRSIASLMRLGAGEDSRPPADVPEKVPARS